MMQLCDTHAHLDDAQLSGDVTAVLARAKAAGVSWILAVGTTLVSSRHCVDLAVEHPEVLASSGIHPNHAADAAEGDWEACVALAELPQVVALGETGLDLYWKDTPLPVQQDFFDRHLRLAQQLDLPVIIHQRESGAEILAMLEEARRRGPLRGVMHSFTGDAEFARSCLDLGLHISFAGMLTFKKSGDLRAVAREIPADRLLVETDSPYLSPEPFRGQRPNEPARVVHTARRLAEARGMGLAELAAQTTANARALFRRGT